tara:strand:- start:294 stop:1169 length:876 start_codon:yes stop_codon:yes gene_type:complete
MTFKIKNMKIFNFLLLAFLVSCSEDNPTANVGESILVVAELPEENQDLEFLWEFIDLPENSVLENINLRIGNDNSSVIFTPDAPGLYSLNVSIFQYNDEVSNQSFTYEIQSDEDSQQISNKMALNDTTVNDLGTAPKDSIQKIESEKWYDSEIAALAVEEINTNENKKIETAVEKPLAKLPIKKSEPKSAPQQKKAKNKKVGMSIPYDKERFTIQVASKKRLDDAKKIAANLINSGYDAYIQKAFFKENNQTWYRIRVGSYNDKSMAQKVAIAISNEQKEKAWVDHVRIEN